MWFDSTNLHNKIYIMICEKCGKDHDGSFGSGRFCSKQCANSHKHSDECISKIKKSLIHYYDGHPERTPHKNTKNICKFCGLPLNTGDHTLCMSHRSKNWYKKFIPFGFDFSKIGTPEFISEYKKATDKLKYEYEVNRLSPKEIFQKYGLDKYFNTFEALSYVLRNIGVQTRSRSESLKVSVEEGRLLPPKGKSNIYHCGWHTTWMGTEVYYRSSYELDYANELDKKHIRYDMECLRIKYWDSISNEYKCAVPDFFLPDTNEIVEIKSNYTFIEQEMKDKFDTYRSLGYFPKLILEHVEKHI